MPGRHNLKDIKMQETRPAKSGVNWPIVHLNGGTAKSTTLLNASGGMSSHWITGYHLDGALVKDDGFHLLRRSCLYFNTTDTWTAADGGASLDIANEAAPGHFAFEMWVYVPTATGAVAGLLTRATVGTEGYTLEITSAGLVKFTIKDGTTSVTITGATSIFGGWHLITVVGERASATGLKLYIDGVSDATAVDISAMNDAVDAAGAVVCTGVSSKDMWVGPIGFYTGASAVLTATTVLANYNGGIGRKYDGSETGLSVAWNNDEGTGATCYDIKNDDGYKSTVSGTAWSPSKQSGGTAAVKKCGPPFRKQDEDDADNPLPAVGLFGTGILTTAGVMNAISVTFPQAIEIGRNNPVRILETNGAFSLILFGFTADA